MIIINDKIYEARYVAPIHESRVMVDVKPKDLQQWLQLPLIYNSYFKINQELYICSDTMSFYHKSSDDEFLYQQNPYDELYYFGYILRLMEVL